MIMKMSFQAVRACAFLALLGALGLGESHGVHAQAPTADGTKDAAAFVRKIGDDIVNIIERKDLDSQQRQAALRKVFTDVFDVDGVAKFVMGRHWRRMSDAQRRRYMAIVPRYVSSIYAQRFDEYSGQRLQVVRSAKTRSGDVVVQTRITGTGQPIDVAIRVVPHESTFRIEDVKVQGVSLLVTKRDEFDSYLSRNDIDDLIAELERRAGAA